MATSLIRTIDGWRFERPLAAALGAATVFAILAMPDARYAALPVVGGLARIAGAVLTACLLAAFGWIAMRRPAPVRPVVTASEEVEADPEADPEPVLRLRRADRHPDAPVREPIRAHRDLGSPFMEVNAESAAPTIVDLPLPPIDVAAITVARPEPVAVAPVHALPAASPRTGRTDLNAMIDRLAAGLAMRAAETESRAPSPALVDALDELNRIAARRR